MPTPIWSRIQKVFVTNWGTANAERLSSDIKPVIITNAADLPEGDGGALPAGNVNDVQLKASASEFAGLTGLLSGSFQATNLALAPVTVTVVKGVITAVTVN